MADNKGSFITTRDIVHVAYESGAVRVWYADIVCEKDVFSYRSGSDPAIHHEPCVFSERGEVVGAYSAVRLKNGEMSIEFMPRTDIDEAKKLSKKPGNWDTWFGEYAKKSVMKRHAKRFANSPELAAIIERDHDEDSQGFGKATSTANGRSNGPAAGNGAAKTAAPEQSQAEDWRQKHRDLNEALAAISDDVEERAAMVRAFAEADGFEGAQVSTLINGERAVVVVNGASNQDLAALVDRARGFGATPSEGEGQRTEDDIPF